MYGQQLLSTEHRSKMTRTLGNMAVCAKMPPNMDSVDCRAAYFMCVGANGNPKGSSQAKVCQLDLALGVDEEVLGLQVPVKDPVRVAEGQALQQLEEVTLGMQALINHFKESVLRKRKSMKSI